jgi:hypothetical protein
MLGLGFWAWHIGAIGVFLLEPSIFVMCYSWSRVVGQLDNNDSDDCLISEK